MSHRKAFEALDRTLQDMKDCKHLMGGVTVVLAGDFRQTLPVVPKGTRADELKSCLKNSYIWNFLKKMKLTTNMRARVFGDESTDKFSKKLLMVGNGELQKTKIRNCNFSPVPILYSQLIYW